MRACHRGKFKPKPTTLPDHLLRNGRACVQSWSTKIEDWMTDGQVSTWDGPTACLFKWGSLRAELGACGYVLRFCRYWMWKVEYIEWWMMSSWDGPAACLFKWGSLRVQLDTCGYVSVDIEYESWMMSTWDGPAACLFNWGSSRVQLDAFDDIQGWILNDGYWYLLGTGPWHACSSGDLYESSSTQVILCYRYLKMIPSLVTNGWCVWLRLLNEHLQGVHLDALVWQLDSRGLGTPYLFPSITIKKQKLTIHHQAQVCSRQGSCLSRLWDRRGGWNVGTKPFR